LFSETTYAQAAALSRLGRGAAAKRLLESLAAHARRLSKEPARIDYFATSLPDLLLFEGDRQRRLRTTAELLLAQAQLGLGRRAAGVRLLRSVLLRDPAHGAAADLLAEVTRETAAPRGRRRRRPGRPARKRRG
jgi:hypothetical protein